MMTICRFFFSFFVSLVLFISISIDGAVAFVQPTTSSRRSAAAATFSSLSSSSVCVRVASSAVFYKDEKLMGTEDLSATTSSRTTTAPSTKVVIAPQQQTMKKKPTIYPISSLEELYEFLKEDEDRLTAIKFHAPWCKSCQRLGLHYHRLAVEWGDGVDVVARQKVAGQIRCASVEYSDLTAHMLQDQLQIHVVPTLQLYRGTTKVWQASGKQLKSTKPLQTILKQFLLIMTKEELDHHIHELIMNDNDDENDALLLEQAMEDAFFDNVGPGYYNTNEYCL